MLSLGPGSACDVYLEPFGAESKAPCSITCGHVFCVNCLQQVSRLTCPLCRTPFDPRHTIRLQIDLDYISPFSPDVPLSSNSDEGARHLQDRITDLAANGATKTQSTQLTEECRRFLQTVPKGMYPDLRTSYKMLAYMCHVKRNFLDQGRELKAVSQEVDRLKAALEVLKFEKRHLEQALSTERDSFSSECERLHIQLDKAQAQMQLLTE
ncbi:RING-type domain-containing protein [Mycena sanguinolenta]|uniref:RING-type domain-containing protein n=1 Tax=Mycena sanguinolenta TaxID=230812 RepID=A0A8H7DJD5_9AGAR|nr:RING-type domain-containing protein [Mycena sanguinolenta]